MLKSSSAEAKFDARRSLGRFEVGVLAWYQDFIAFLRVFAPFLDRCSFFAKAVRERTLREVFWSDFCIYYNLV